jgi:hypothetical protein
LLINTYGENTAYLPASDGQFMGFFKCGTGQLLQSL